MGNKGLSIVLWALAFVLGIVLIIYWVSGYFVSYKYESQIGSYMETATDTISPESFKEQLILYKKSINESGLNENDYGAMWFKKPDNSMRFQIQHVDSILERADAMILWKNTAYNSTGATTFTNPEAFRDVYNDKMNNLRTYIHAEGYRSDWISEDAWYVKNHPFYYFMPEISVILILIIGSFIIVGGMLWD